MGLRWLVSWATALLMAGSTAAWGQTPPPPTGVRPGDVPLPPPTFPDEERRPEFVPPEAPPPPEAPERVGEGLRIFVTRFVLEGNTVISEKELRDKVLSKHEGQALTTEDLIKVRNELTLEYINRGYINSGAVIPDQDVKDGVILIRIVEGTLPLDQIEINELQILKERYVRNRINRAVREPLNINPLQDQLQLMLTDPSIDGIQARLGPGTRPGDARLDVIVDEAPRFNVSVFANNDRPVSVGEYQGILVGTTRSVLGFSDPLTLSFSITEGLRDGFGAYSVPLTARDLRFFVQGQVTDADVVQKPFDVLDIESETWSVDVGFSHPIHRSVHQKSESRGDQEVTRTVIQEYAASLFLTRRHSETRLLGRPFSFSPGADRGETDVTAIRFLQSALWRDDRQVIQGRSTFSLGIDAWGATINESTPDSQYFAWLGQAQYARRLGEKPGHELLVQGNLQIAAQSLVSIEQFSVGGLYSVRGYRRNELIRDSGWQGSIEYRYPLFRIPIPRISRTPEDGVVQIAPFFDAGGGWNVDLPTPEPKAIYSIGAGVRWRPAPLISAAIYYGYQLKDVLELGEKGLQDRGVYFDVRAGIDF